MLRTRMCAVSLLVVAAAFGVVLHLRSKSTSSEKSLQGQSCERGVSTARQGAALSYGNGPSPPNTSSTYDKSAVHATFRGAWP